LGNAIDSSAVRTALLARLAPLRHEKQLDQVDLRSARALPYRRPMGESRRMRDSLQEDRTWWVAVVGGASAGTLVTACSLLVRSHHLREARTLVQAGLPAGIGAGAFGLTLAFVAKRKVINLKAALGLLLPWAVICFTCVGLGAASWSAFAPATPERASVVAQLAVNGLHEEGYWIWFDVRQAAVGGLWAVVGAVLATFRMARRLNQLTS
jgi:hypothetical protein